jgi:hypothetical protein
VEGIFAFIETEWLFVNRGCSGMVIRTDLHEVVQLGARTQRLIRKDICPHVLRIRVTKCGQELDGYVWTIEVVTTQ